MRRRPSLLTWLSFGLAFSGVVLFVSTREASARSSDPALPASQEQDSAEEDEFDLTPPFQAYLRDEKLRLEEEIVGAWMLVTYDAPNEFVAAEDARGFATFVDGYMTLIFEGRETIDALFGPDEFHIVDADASRYQIGHGNTLQLANILGFTNAVDGELESTRGRLALQYELSIDAGLLTLKIPGGAGYTFRRMGESMFPSRAVDALRSSRNDYRGDDR